MAKFKLISDGISNRWFIYIDSLKDLYEYISFIETKELQDIEIAKVDLKQQSHFRSNIACTANVLHWAKTLTSFEKYGTEDQLITSINDTQSLRLKTYKDILQKHNHVIINENGGCNTIIESNVVLDEQEQTDFAFPVHKTLLTTDFKIKKWFGGKHYYISYCGRTIEDDDGTSKFNTYEYACKVRDKFISKNKS